MSKAWLRIVPIFLLGAYLVIPQLHRLGLWVDEGWTVYATGGNNLSDVTRWLKEDVHPPLYFYLLYGWRHLTGDSEFAVRYLSALMVLLGIAVTYRLGKALFGENAGTIAALFYALHDLVRVLGAESRQYPLLQLLAGTTLWTYYRFWQHPTRRRGLWFVLSGAALLWTQYWGGFILLGLALHAVTTRSKQLQPFLITNALIGLSFVPWLPVLYEQITGGIPDGLGHALPATKVGHLTLLYQLLGLPEVWWGLLAVFGALATLKLARPYVSAESSIPALAVFLPVGLTVAINYNYAIMSFRTLSVVLIPLLVLIGHTLAQFQRREQVILVGILVVHSLATTSAQPPLHLPWEEVGQFVARHSTAEDEVLVEIRFDAYAMLYYLEEDKPAIHYRTTEVDRHANPDEFEATLAQDLADVQGLWVVKHDPPFYDIRLQLNALGFINTTNLIWGPSPDWTIELWRFDRRPALAIAEYGQELQLLSAQTDATRDHFTLNLLWSPTVKPTQNAIISVFLLDASGALRVQHDSQPLEWRTSTLGWEAGGLYFDSHVLEVANLPDGQYQVGVKVYYFDPSGAIQIVPVAGCPENICDYLVVGTWQK